MGLFPCFEIINTYWLELCYIYILIEMCPNCICNSYYIVLHITYVDSCNLIQVCQGTIHDVLGVWFNQWYTLPYGLIHRQLYHFQRHTSLHRFYHWKRKIPSGFTQNCPYCFSYNALRAVIDNSCTFWASCLPLLPTPCPEEKQENNGNKSLKRVVFKACSTLYTDMMILKWLITYIRGFHYKKNTKCHQLHINTR